MSDNDDGREPPPFTCKFLRPDDTDARNDILRRPPTTIEEWKESVERCTEMVNERLDDIERRIRESGGG
jgi:hypothetical protein